MDLPIVPLITEPLATFSPDRLYRYTLWRMWPDLFIDASNYVMFVGLNPSTADEVRDDPTIRRCIKFAQAWGFGSMCMTNLFAFRATDPDDMKAAEEPVGPGNDEALIRIAKGAGLVVSAWGADGVHLGRADDVVSLLATSGVTLHSLKVTKGGHPGHPLYLKKTSVPVPWRWAPGAQPTEWRKPCELTST